MATPTKQKSEKVKAPSVAATLGYTRFGIHNTQTASRTFITGLQGRQMRNEEWFERHDAVLLSKFFRHGWVQRSRCGQKWQAYCPYAPNDFRCKGARTMREALVILAGWLGFNEIETYNHTR